MATGKGAQLPPLVQASAGAIGAVVSNAIIFPLDLASPMSYWQSSQTRPLTFGC